MDESIQTDATLPRISEALIKNVAAILDVKDPSVVDKLGERVQRYSDRYHLACHQLFSPSASFEPPIPPIARSK